MTDAVTLRRSYGCLLLALSLSGCAATPVPLVNITGSGEQWVWPFFLQGQATVIAFWNTDTMQSLRDVPALKTLDAREGSVELVTVVTGRDRLEIQKWLRRERIGYVVLLDLEEKLASQLHVYYYPTYVYIDSQGKEIDRVTDVRLVGNWFDRERWLVRAGAIAPASGSLEE